jgi:hypothetical protein
MSPLLLCMGIRDGLYQLRIGAFFTTSPGVRSKWQGQQRERRPAAFPARTPVGAYHSGSAVR